MTPTSKCGYFATRTSAIADGKCPPIGAESRRSTFIGQLVAEETNMPDVQTAYEPPRIEKWTTIELMLIGVASGFLIGK